MGTRRYTEQRFRDALADPDVRTLADLCRRLGIVPRGGNYESLRRYADQLGVELPPVSSRTRAAPIDEQRLREAVGTSRSMAAVLRALGLPDAGGTRRRVHDAIERLGLDTSHHLGQGWSAGQTRESTRTRIEQLGDGRARNGYLIKRILLRGGWPHRCQACGREEWEGGPIPLEVDHIDGDRRHGAVENLRLLCPNCHALTPTYRGRNIGARDRARTARATDQPSSGSRS